MLQLKKAPVSIATFIDPIGNILVHNLGSEKHKKSAAYKPIKELTPENRKEVAIGALLYVGFLLAGYAYIQHLEIKALTKKIARLEELKATLEAELAKLETAK